MASKRDFHQAEVTIQIISGKPGILKDVYNVTSLVSVLETLLVHHSIEITVKEEKAMTGPQTVLALMEHEDPEEKWTSLGLDGNGDDLPPSEEKLPRCKDPWCTIPACWEKR